MRLAVLVCLVALLAGVACDRRPPLRTRKENLLLLPRPWRRPSIHVADDGRHATFSVRDGDGYHVVTPSVWPPAKKRGVPVDGDNPVEFRCTVCGSVVLVYPDNDPEMSGIKVIAPEKREAAAKK